MREREPHDQLRITVQELLDSDRAWDQVCSIMRSLQAREWQPYEPDLGAHRFLPSEVITFGTK